MFDWVLAVILHKNSTPQKIEVGSSTTFTELSKTIICAHHQQGNGILNFANNIVVSRWL